MSAPALEVVGLRKTYARDGRTLDVLDLAHLSVADGEFVTVVGPSGCGKSTFLHVLGGFIPCDAGRIRVHGRAVVGPGPDRGMVFQEYALFPWRTLSGNVGWGLETRGAPAAERKAVVDRYLELTGLTEFRDHLPAELSGGMKQRVAGCAPRRPGARAPPRSATRARSRAARGPGSPRRGARARPTRPPPRSAARSPTGRG